VDIEDEGRRIEGLGLPIEPCGDDGEAGRDDMKTGDDMEVDSGRGAIVGVVS
jgi:hypothetical protein